MPKLKWAGNNSYWGNPRQPLEQQLLDAVPGAGADAGAGSSSSWKMSCSTVRESERQTSVLGAGETLSSHVESPAQNIHGSHQQRWCCRYNWKERKGQVVVCCCFFLFKSKARDMVFKIYNSLSTENYTLSKDSVLSFSRTILTGDECKIAPWPY